MNEKMNVKFIYGSLSLLVVDVVIVVVVVLGAFRMYTVNIKRVYLNIERMNGVKIF